MPDIPALTPKQRRFVEEYLVDLNATQAAIRAGYSARTARQAGAEALSKPVIAEAVAAEMQRRETRSRVKAFRVLEELAPLCYSSLDHYRIGRSGHVRLTPDAPPDAMRAVAAIKRKRREIEREDGKPPVVEVETEIKLWDKNTALTNAMKHLGMLIDRHEVSGKGGAPLSFTLAIGETRPGGDE